MKPYFPDKIAALASAVTCAADISGCISYVATFGLEATARGRLATAANIPGMNLSFSATRTPVVATRGRAIDHIGFEVKDLAAAVKALEAKGIKFDGPVRTDADVRHVTLVDPQGVTVELTQGLAAY